MLCVYMKHLKKISEETIHANPWWRYKHDTYEKPNGEVGDYYYGETNGLVILIPVLENGKIILTLQYRYLMDRVSIEFPGGGIKPGMELLEAARQELFEETGWIADEMTNIGSFESSNGLAKDRGQVFMVQVVEQQAQQLDDTEQIELLYRTPSEIEEMVEHNDIWCGQTLAAWSLARQRFLAEPTKTTAPPLSGIIEQFLS